MALEQAEWELEKARLKMIIRELEEQIGKNFEITKNFKKEAISIQKEMWEEVKLTTVNLMDLEGATQAWQYQMQIESQARKYKHSGEALQKLERLYLSPYFGRIDFLEEGESSPEQVYIGISTLKDTRSGSFLIYDWRAPISSMFYDYEIGKSGYDCPMGIISGELLLKRQYKIANRQIDYMFDSSLKIDDEILQEVLCKSVDSRMKIIVASIQREQNSIIRNDKNKILIVQGVAGSGKTSIALHRAAYLLYKYRESIHAENIVIFSPNQVFNDYISDVLPELGEENICQTTFREHFLKMIESNILKEDAYDQMEYLLNSRGQADYKTRAGSIRFKASLQFMEALKKYIQLIEKDGILFKDIFYNSRLIISGEELSDLFTREYAKLPLGKRLEKIRNRIYFLLQPYEKKTEGESEEKNNRDGKPIRDDGTGDVGSNMVLNGLKALKENIDGMTALNFYQIYINLFKDRELLQGFVSENPPENLKEICQYTLESLQNNQVKYEDLAPLVYLKGKTGSFPDASSIKHVIIDEVQDYTPLQIEIINSTFSKCNITMLGDINQSINSHMSVGNYQTISEIFKNRDAVTISLNKSYRSTREITDFSKEILLDSKHIEYLNRSGEKPEIVRAADSEHLMRCIAEEISRIKEKGFQSIAVICRTAGQSAKFHKYLQKHMSVNFISKSDAEFTKGVVVVPSYLAKGLEFDAVLICCTGGEDYSSGDERNLFYTICTRALHVLNIYYIDELPGFVSHIDPQYYDMR